MESIWTDSKKENERYLTKKEAEMRASLISDVSYKMCFCLVPKKPSFYGTQQATFSLKSVEENIFVDFKGREVLAVEINETTLQHAEHPDLFNAHKIQLPAKYLKVGKNTVNIQYHAEYVSDCQGMQKYTDEVDKQEYFYTESEPFSSHKWFPCFNQPDLKAAYELLVLAFDEWTVIANAAGKVLPELTQDLRDEYKLRAVHLESFGDYKYRVHQFAKSAKISTYLYCVVVGPYACFEPNQENVDEKIPMKLYCRPSLKEEVAKIAQDWFRVTRHGIRFYEKIFSTPYPFDKFDQVFCPDYRMGAMENVGLVTYNDLYISRGEKFTRNKTENIYNTILHEISHMWFGNLVTMKWWDDLWLNESFANVISYICMDQAPGLEDITLAWNIFLEEQFWGLKTDAMDTSHPIAASCQSTGDAEDIFDGISYGKGASWLKQMLFMYGQETLQEGLKTYFQKHSFSNTVLMDFVSELAAAAKKTGAV